MDSGQRMQQTLVNKAIYSSNFSFRLFANCTHEERNVNFTKKKHFPIMPAFHFSVSKDELSKLCEAREPKMLHEMGGTEGICDLLKSNIMTGLGEEEETWTQYQTRRDQYVCNTFYLHLCIICN